MADHKTRTRLLTKIEAECERLKTKLGLSWLAVGQEENRVVLKRDGKRLAECWLEMDSETWIVVYYLTAHQWTVMAKLPIFEFKLAAEKTMTLALESALVR